MPRAAERSRAKTSRGTKAQTETPVADSVGLDLSSMDRDALVQLQREVDAALGSYEKRTRENALREMESVAQRYGLALKDLIQSSDKRSVTVPKYRHPENPALTWSGRGRQPAWFKEAIDAGVSRDDLLIA